MTEAARPAEEVVADVAERLVVYVVRYEAARDSGRLRISVPAVDQIPGDRTERR